jgi:tRNA threonylcarbamoyladenosine biosynthesis protein TsaB
MQHGAPILAIDTCGPSGSVALGRLAGRDLEVFGHTELEGRTYSVTLIPAVRGLLAAAQLDLRDLGGIVVLHGPGSFTGVRVGLSAVKGLASAHDTPVVAFSRLLVLSRKAGVPSAALDAHRGEIFLRLECMDKDRTASEPRELLAGPSELAAEPPPPRIAVCDDASALLLAAAWPATLLVKAAPPSATDALRLGESRLVTGIYADLALLDGHYLRRSDAEIFGKPLSAATHIP